MEGDSLEALRQLQMALVEGLLTLEEHAEEKRKVLQGTFNPSHAHLIYASSERSLGSQMSAGAQHEKAEKAGDKTNRPERTHGPERPERPHGPHGPHGTERSERPEMPDIHERLFRTTRTPRPPSAAPTVVMRPPSWHPGVKEWRYCSGHVQTTVYGWRGEFATRQSWDSPEGALWYRV